MLAKPLGAAFKSATGWNRARESAYAAHSSICEISKTL